MSTLRMTGAALATFGWLSFACGCGGNPLEGRWAETIGEGSSKISAVLDLNGDGTAGLSETVLVDAMGFDCKGGVQTSGWTWTSTDAQISIEGKGTCKSTLVCTINGKPQPQPCSGELPSPGTCKYELSSDDDTLTLRDCNGASSTMADEFSRVQ